MLPPRGLGRRGSNLADLSRHNRNFVFHIVRRYGPVTKPEIAEASGLTPVTVTNIIRDLEAEKWVTPAGYAPSRGGRRALQYRVNTDAGRLIAVDAAGYRLDVALLDFAGNILERSSRPWNLEEETPTLTVIEAINSMMKATDRKKVLGIALSVPGIVDPANGTVLHAVPLGWRGVALQTIVEDTFQRPAAVYNQTHSAVFGELQWWPPDWSHVLYLAVGTGIGMGMVVDGEILGGRRGMSGELGHTIVEPDGPLCQCGNRGCLEHLASIKALVKYVREEGGTVSADAEGLSRLFRAAGGQDGPERRALQRVCRYLALAVVNTARLFDPDIILVAGPEEDEQQLLLKYLREAVAEHPPLVSTTGEMAIQPARLGQSARLIGCAVRLLEDIFARGTAPVVA